MWLPFVYFAGLFFHTLNVEWRRLLVNDKRTWSWVGTSLTVEQRRTLTHARSLTAIISTSLPSTPLGGSASASPRPTGFIIISTITHFRNTYRENHQHRTHKKPTSLSTHANYLIQLVHSTLETKHQNSVCVCVCVCVLKRVRDWEYLCALWWTQVRPQMEC